ncbi:hypothetical protein Q4595_05720 [Wenyingzhuangia sp. 1_MG-2023]|nr:hypothetical protein [Wenyingzhuangia sp. 1_MG-2023]
MKLLKLSILFLLTVFLSCSEEESNKPSGTYLTINGDTREIINNGDSDLKIIKETVKNASTSWFRHDGDLWLNPYDIISLEISDPNNSLIANFGDFNINTLTLRFALPSNFEAGSYTTKGYSNDRISLEPNYSFSQFIKLLNIKTGQTYEVLEDGNKWIVEFNNLEYVSNLEFDTDNTTAVISGRIILNK